MDTQGISALVTGGASGLGLAAARRLLAAGARVVIADLPGSPGEEVARGRMRVSRRPTSPAKTT